MENTNKKIGVVIGRFQTPFLHVGHRHLIDSANRENDVLVILVGTRVDETIVDEKNPYSFEERETKIKEIYPNSIVLKLSDVPNNDVLWSENISKTILNIDTSYKEEDITLYHSRDSFVSHYLGILKTQEIPEISGISATEIRRIQQEVKDSVLPIIYIRDSSKDTVGYLETLGYDYMTTSAIINGYKVINYTDVRHLVFDPTIPIIGDSDDYHYWLGKEINNSTYIFGYYDNGHKSKFKNLINSIKNKIGVGGQKILSLSYDYSNNGVVVSKLKDSVLNAKYLLYIRGGELIDKHLVTLNNKHMSKVMISELMTLINGGLRDCIIEAHIYDEYCKVTIHQAYYNIKHCFPSVNYFQYLIDTHNNTIRNFSKVL